MEIKPQVQIRTIIDESFVQRYIDLFDDPNRLYWDEGFIKERTFLKGPLVPEAILFSLIGKGLTKMFGPARLWNTGEYVNSGAAHLNEELILDLKLAKKYYEEFTRYRVKFRIYHLEIPTVEVNGRSMPSGPPRPRIVCQGDVWCSPLMSEDQFRIKQEFARERLEGGVQF